MTPNAVEFGKRYSDDSGWERRVRIDLHADRVDIKVAGGSLTTTTEEAKWLIDALTKAVSACNP